MIGYIKGKLLSFEDGVILLENNGIGYELTCSKALENKIIKDGGGEAYTYMAVREDGVSLYGFINPAEKNMFLKLISVSGVGPKMGITVLSNLDIESLAVMIASSDVKGLSAVKGLGKKTAERIILELREKVQAVPQGGSSIVTKEKPNEDAVIALMSLGFNRNESEKVLIDAKNSGANTIEELIAYSLRHIR